MTRPRNNSSSFGDKWHDLFARPCEYATDRERITELILAYRLANGVHVYPTTWRVRLLLTSRVWQPERDTCIWENASGQMVGLAMLWRRKPNSPYLVLDRFVHPSYVSSGLISAMTKWGIQRAEEIAAGQNEPIPLYACQFKRSIHPGDNLEQYGFSLNPPDPHEYDVYYARSLQDLPPQQEPPPGYVIRPLRDLDELEAYQNLYTFAAVNPQHLRELSESDEYRHLVMVDAEGRFVAYCECSICRAEWRDENPPTGWIDYIGTRPDQQGRGLGRAILIAGLAQLQAWGATTAWLVTINSNTAAGRLYEKTGFERMNVSEPVVYKKQLPVISTPAHDLQPEP